MTQGCMKMRLITAVLIVLALLGAGDAMAETLTPADPHKAKEWVHFIAGMAVATVMYWKPSRDA